MNKCIKCGGVDIHVKYRKSSVDYTLFEQERKPIQTPSGEHLSNYCRTCQYVWASPCEDAKELNDIFQRLGLTMLDGGMVSISGVKITPDLFDARIYLSFFKVNDAVTALQMIKDKSFEIKKELTSRVRHQLRSMPQLSFYIDDTLDYVDKIEKLFKDIKSEEDKNNPKK